MNHVNIEEIYDAVKYHKHQYDLSLLEILEIAMKELDENYEEAIEEINENEIKPLNEEVDDLERENQKLAEVIVELDEKIEELESK